MKTAKMTLGGTEYTFDAWTVEQLERMGDLQENTPEHKIGFRVFAMAMENANPPVPDASRMRVSPGDISGVINLVNSLSGLETSDKPGAVPAVGEKQPKA